MAGRSFRHVKNVCGRLSGHHKKSPKKHQQDVWQIFVFLTYNEDLCSYFRCVRHFDIDPNDNIVRYLSPEEGAAVLIRQAT